MSVAVAMMTVVSCVGKGTREMVADAVAVPVRWQQGSSLSKTFDVALWWRRFRDPVLNELIAEALKASPTVRSALEKVTEYRARRGVESANLFPSLAANQSGRGARKTRGVTTSESYQASFDVSWQVDLFGKQFQTLKAATAEMEQIGENFYGAQVTLAADVATAYVALRSAEAQLSVVQRSLGTRGETVQLTQWREQAGTGDALDTQRSISTLEQARASMPALQLSVVQSKNQLALLSGRTPGSLDARLAGSGRVPEMISRIAAGVPAEALRQRPDVRAAERALEAAFARTHSAKRERLPSLNLSGSIGIDALKAGNIFSPEAAIVSVLASLATPVIDAGRIRQNIRAVSSRERQALIAYEATVLTALAEVENALAAVRRYAEQHRIVLKAAAAAREADTLAAWQYEAGQVDLLVALDAQRTLLTLEQQDVTTMAQSANACVQLYQALGGGWSPF